MWWLLPQQQKWYCYLGVFWRAGSKSSHHSGNDGWWPLLPHSLVNLRSFSVDLIMWSLSIAIHWIWPEPLGLWSCFVHPFNEAMYLQILLVFQVESLVSSGGRPFLHQSLQRSWLPLPWDQWVVPGFWSFCLFYLASEDLDLLWLGQMHAAHDVQGCQCRHTFSDSSSWTASTEVPPKELCWLPCTYWRRLVQKVRVP